MVVCCLNKFILLYYYYKALNIMRIALLLRGMAYCQSYRHPNRKSMHIDYRKSIMNYKDYIFKDNEVDVFYHTYYSDELDVNELQMHYKPKSYSLTALNENPSNPNLHKYQSCTFSLMSVIDLFNLYCTTHHTNYDYIVITRFDLLFKIRLNNLPLEKNKFMISCMTENSKLMDDNFFIASDRIKLNNYLDVLIRRDNNKMLHFDYEELVRVLPKSIKILVGGNHVISNGTPLYNIVRHEIDRFTSRPNELFQLFNLKTLQFMTIESNTKFKLESTNGYYLIKNENNHYVGTDSVITSDLVLMKKNVHNTRLVKVGFRLDIVKSTTIKTYKIACTLNMKTLTIYNSRPTLVYNMADEWIIF